MRINLKYFFITLISGLLVGSFFLKNQTDSKLHIFFCNVGQGDAIYIRFPNNQDMLIDGGPDNKVLDCLSQSMPFYDREIDLVLLTHPEADHLTGLITVLERYRVLYFVSSPAGNNTLGFQKIRDLITAKNIKVKNLYAGETIEFGSVVFRAVWPEKSWAYNKLGLSLSNKSSVLGAKSDLNDLNDFSLMGILSYKDFDVFLPGDGDERVQDDVLKEGSSIVERSIEILKVPHHGAKTSLTPEFLIGVQPKLAVISVGKNNRYGHPASNIIKQLNDLGVTIERTDTDGTIEIISDGDSWWED